MAAFLSVTAIACGDAPAEHAEDSDGPSPFTVDLDVDGYRAVTAGTGTDLQIWGDDGDSTHEPFTALRRPGRDGLAGVVLVSVTGFEGQQGGLGQSSFGLHGTDLFAIDGRDAIYSPPDENGRGPTWADLVVVVGDDLAVRVTTPEATREELVAWFERVEAHGRERPPSIEPGDDLELIGTVGVDAAIASRARAAPNTDQVPGSESSLGVGWAREDEEHGSLAIVALSGDAADLEALAVGQMVLGWRDPVIELTEEGAQQILVIDEDPPEGWPDRRAVWTEAPNGDLLMARASGAVLPSRDELLALLRGVEPADEAAWEAMVIEATGGPGLHADEGRVEIARGTVGDLEWLMQTGDEQVISYPEEPGPTDGVYIDACLKLSNRRRACGGGGGGSNLDWIYSVPEPDRPVPPYVLLSTSLDAAAVRVTTRTDQVTAPLHKVPGVDLWGAVVFVDDPGNAGGCDDYPPGTVPQDHEFLGMRVDALDAQGNVIACLGFGPGSHEGGI